MKLPAVIAGAALALQIAKAPPPAVAEAYARLAEARPDLIAQQNTTSGQQELLRWLPFHAPNLSKTATLIYGAILAHRNHKRGDAYPGYARIAEMYKCSSRTAIRAVDVLEATGFLGVERRFRLEDRWEGSHRHDRTNVYTFHTGAPVEDALDDGGADEEPTAPTPSRPNAAPAPARPTVPSTPPRPAPTSDPYWDIFEEAFILEHHAAYGKDSKPGSVRQDHLRDRASDVLHDLASECAAWARQPERGLHVEHLRVAEDLARRLARAWIRSPGRDNRHRDHGHPIGWMCCDLTRSLLDAAVEGWKRAQRRLIPKAVAPVRHDAEDPIIVDWARQFGRLPPEQRAAAILRFVQRCIRYERDPAWYDAEGTRHGIELLDSAAVGLHRGYGDCDLKARLFVALCLGCGVTADIEPVFTGETGFPHVQARVLTDTSETGGERWETADPSIVNSTIGRLPRKALTAFPREAA